MKEFLDDFVTFFFLPVTIHAGFFSYCKSMSMHGAEISLETSAVFEPEFIWCGTDKADIPISFCIKCIHGQRGGEVVIIFDVIDFFVRGVNSNDGRNMGADIGIYFVVERVH